MIPDIIAVVFLAIPLLCLVYIFRGISTEENPIWGNVLASALSAIICAMVAIWFFSGTIVSPSVVGNASYQISSSLSSEELLSQQSNASNTITVLGVGGSGMFIRSAVSAATGNELINQTTVTVHTYDIVYQQFQDLGLVFFYAFLCLVSIALFVWFIIDLRNELHERENHDEFLE